MGFHHVAIATKDIRATHDFYTRAMGFRLVKGEPIKTETGGWAKHLFYDTGGGMIAFWDLHDPSIGDDWSADIARGLGLPAWTNHLAWRAASRADLEAHKHRWLDYGLDVAEIDHGWCRSIYVRDPNGITVEWCVTTQEFSEADRRRGLELLEDPQPELGTPPETLVHRAPKRAAAARGKGR